MQVNVREMERTGALLGGSDLVQALGPRAGGQAGGVVFKV